MIKLFVASKPPVQLFRLVPESPKWTNQSFSDHKRTSVEDKLMGDKDVEEV